MLNYVKHFNRFYQREEYWDSDFIYNSSYYLYESLNNPWKEDSDISWSIMKRQLTQLVKEEEE